MSLFSRNFDRPGPGVRKDEPRKKGFKRFFELIGRDSGSLFKANLLCTITCIPGAMLLTFGLLSNNVIITAVGGILGGMLLAPFWAGIHDTVLRALRDEPGYWWHTYKRALKNNWKQSLLPGAICGIMVASQLLSLWLFLNNAAKMNVMVGAMLALNMLITGMCIPFLWSQLVLMDMPFSLLLKNTFFFALGNAPKAILMSFLQGIYWGAIVLFLPFTSLWVLLFGFAFITIICQMITFPILDKQFDLEAQLIARREALLNGEDPDQK